MGSLLYEQLQLLSLGLQGEREGWRARGGREGERGGRGRGRGREREREREGEREGGREKEGVILNKDTMYVKPSRYMLV